jgi:hypothetical protein
MYGIETPQVGFPPGRLTKRVIKREDSFNFSTPGLAPSRLFSGSLAVHYASDASPEIAPVVTVGQAKKIISQIRSAPSRMSNSGYCSGTSVDNTGPVRPEDGKRRFLIFHRAPLSGVQQGKWKKRIHF